jgi:hypothetical protein
MGGIVVETREIQPSQSFLRVRRAVWLLLAGALLLAALCPAWSLWRASSSELTVRGCLWPARPAAGQQAQLYIVLDDMADRAAVDGPWSRVVATWDMADMHMGARKVEMTGSHGGSGHFALPLRLDMAGPWWVEASLQAPGRPLWHAIYRFDVLPQSIATASPTPAASQNASGDPCGPGGGGRLL